MLILILIVAFSKLLILIN